MNNHTFFSYNLSRNSNMLNKWAKEIRENSKQYLSEHRVKSEEREDKERKFVTGCNGLKNLSPKHLTN